MCGLMRYSRIESCSSCIESLRIESAVGHNCNRVLRIQRGDDALDEFVLAAVGAARCNQHLISAEGVGRRDWEGEGLRGDCRDAEL